MKLFSHGILGMNARNLKYIRTKNSREAMSLADSKLNTKNFLSARGIPFAENYMLISTTQELKDFSFRSLRASSFVIKPNRGSAGRGILVVRRRKKRRYIVGREVWTEDELKLHMSDILGGTFSLQRSSDMVVIEELLEPGEGFSLYCGHGLADIRIIVYNYVPVAAMVRVPTEYSGGKANLAQGGIGLGLNIANGQVISLLHDKKVHTLNFPKQYASWKEKFVPFWDDLLLYSSQVQMHTKLGYIALDWVITKNGPKLLEINARAGLEIQNVTLIPLQSRLRKVEGLRILSPEKGVEVAKTLFHTDTLVANMNKKVIFLHNIAIINDQYEVTIIADADIKKTTVTRDIAEYSSDGTLRARTNSGVDIVLEDYQIVPDETATIKLGMDVLPGFLLDPTPLKDRAFLVPSSKKNQWSKEILNFDHMVHRLSKKVNLSSLLKPDNYFEALDEYLDQPRGYNPIFSYHFLSPERALVIRDEIDRLQTLSGAMQQSGFLLAPLYNQKLDEISQKLSLIEAYRDQDYDSITKYNSLLFGETDNHLLAISKEKVLEMPANQVDRNQKLGRILSIEEVISRVHQYFESRKLKKIPIRIDRGNLSRMSISYGREVRINIARTAVIREKEMDAILAHEIGTHFYRYLSGTDIGLRIFQFGTGYYLGDEEGFAIYQSLSRLPEGYEKNAMYLKYYLIFVADTLSFSETSDLLRSLFPGKTPASIFSDAVRLKRGTIDTSIQGIPGTTYHKDKIYLSGYDRVSRWIEQGGDFQQLLFGKIKIADLPIINHYF